MSLEDMFVWLSTSSTFFILVSGIIVIVSAVLLYWIPQRHLLWGILIIAFSVFNFFLIINVIPGLVGGILAMKWKNPVT